jgi:hypothetical protein
MLVMRRLTDSTSKSDDRGAVLVTVVVVMIVGFIVAGTIAASVMFTIRANNDNRDNLEAFVAAESGRDVAYAAVDQGCSATSFTATTPAYVATIYWATGAMPITSDGLGSPACPPSSHGPTDPQGWVIINSVGTGPDGSVAEIDAVYPWSVDYDQQPGGTLSYFSQFSANKSSYEGDLVVRQGPYTCPNLATIDGDLWVVNGAVDLSSTCHVTGNIYARGSVTISSSGTKVDGEIVALGAIEIASNDVTIGGDIHSGSTVNLKNTGNTSGIVANDAEVKAVGTVTVGDKWKRADGSAIVGITPAATPVFAPTLEAVFGMTTWIDLTSQNWGSGERLATCDANPITQLSAASAPLILDYTACGSAVTISPAGGAVTRDVVFLVAPASRMIVELKNNLSVSAGSPQLMFVHTDPTLDDIPTCGNGNQNDKFDVSEGVAIQPRVLLYTPCGLTGNVKSDFNGQLYTANDGTFAVDATFVCNQMSWQPSLPSLSCLVRGEAGGGSGTPPTVTQSLGELRYQTEK